MIGEDTGWGMEKGITTVSWPIFGGDMVGNLLQRLRAEKASPRPFRPAGGFAGDRAVFAPDRALRSLPQRLSRRKMV